jgi:GNAT superfamily N-acetyltransferase
MKGSIQLLKSGAIAPDVTRAILKMGAASRMWKAVDIEYFSRQLANLRNINVVYLSDSGDVLGHILARPHNEAVEDYLEEDPQMKHSDVPMYYVDHLNVDASVSGRSIGMILILAMAKEANRLNVYRFSNHCRTTNGLSAAVQRRFKDGLHVIRRIPSYVDCNNEPFDYLEVDIRA